MVSEYAKGTEIRLVTDPGRKGVLTGRSRERAGVIVYHVKFDDGAGYHPEYELEVIPEDSADDPWEMLGKAQFGNLRDLRRNLTHIQLSGKLANLVYSMDTTNTEFYAYQFKPVLSFLESPSKGLLIADEVGLGKTIEAGLIWTELRARYDARRLLVVCPAMLREKWKDELISRFGITARIVDAADLATELVQDKNVVPDGQGLVCSLQGARPPKGWNDDDEEAKKSGAAKLARLMDELSDGDPAVDLVIVDEAHYMRNPDSQSAKLGRMLRDISENVVLLSATPINLRSDDLYHLLNLVDPDSFGVKEIFPQVLEANEPLQRARQLTLDVRATATEILDELDIARSHPLLADSRQLEGLLAEGQIDSGLKTEAGRVELANRIERINLLQHAVSRTRKVEVTELKVVREPKTHFVQLDPEGVERAFYDAVTLAIREYAVERDVSEGFLLATPQKQVSSCMYSAAKAWRAKRRDFQELLYEDFGVEGSLDKEFSPLIDHLCRNVLPQFDLDDLRRHDSKFDALKELLLSYFRTAPNEKVIIFSFFRETINYLAERLAEAGISGSILMGGMDKPKQQVIDEFRNDPNVRVLISSEVASEGVDLQFCRVLVNYDLPWNPMKVEQRIGRIDRIGQEADKISIRNFCYGDTIDQRVYERLLERLNIFERALGGLEAVLGEEIASLTGDLLSQQLTPEEEERRITQSALAIERIRQDEDDLEKKASHLIAHGGYILEQVEAAHQFRRRIMAGDLVVYVRDYLNRYGQGYELRQENPDELLFDMRLPASVANAFGSYIKERRLFGRTNLAAGDRQKCRFINKVKDPRSREEYINQFHPLIRFISHDLRERGERFVPLVAVSLAADRVPEIVPGTYAFAMSRWSFEGLRTDEELQTRAIRLDSDTLLSADESWELVNYARLDGSDWLQAPTVLDIPALNAAIERCDVTLLDEYEAAVRSRDNENRDRVSFQVQSAESHQGRKLAVLQDVLQKHRINDRQPLIKATEGRIRKLNERFDIQIDRLRSKENLQAHHFDVSIGAIEVA